MLITRTRLAPKLRIILKCTAASPLSLQRHVMGWTLPFTNQDIDSRSTSIHGWLHCGGSATNIPMSNSASWFLTFKISNTSNFMRIFNHSCQRRKLILWTSQLRRYSALFLCLIKRRAVPVGHMVIRRWSCAVVRRLKYVNENQHSRSVKTTAHTVWWRHTSGNSLQPKLGSTLHFAAARYLTPPRSNRAVHQPSYIKRTTNTHTLVSSSAEKTLLN